MNAKTVDGKKLAIIAWAKDEKGEEDVAVFTGVASWNGKQLTLLRHPEQDSFVIPNDWLSRLKEMTPDLRDILLDADFSISVSVGLLPDNADLSQYENLPLRWPHNE